MHIIHFTFLPHMTLFSQIRLMLYLKIESNSRWINITHYNPLLCWSLRHINKVDGSWLIGIFKNSILKGRWSSLFFFYKAINPSIANFRLLFTINSDIYVSLNILLGRDEGPNFLVCRRKKRRGVVCFSYCVDSCIHLSHCTFFPDTHVGWSKKLVIVPSLSNLVFRVFTCQFKHSNMVQRL